MTLHQSLPISDKGPEVTPTDMWRCVSTTSLLPLARSSKLCRIVKRFEKTKFGSFQFSNAVDHPFSHFSWYQNVKIISKVSVIIFIAFEGKENISTDSYDSV